MHDSTPVHSNETETSPIFSSSSSSSSSSFFSFFFFFFSFFSFSSSSSSSFSSSPYPSPAPPPRFPRLNVAVFTMAASPRACASLSSTDSGKPQRRQGHGHRGVGEPVVDGEADAVGPDVGDHHGPRARARGTRPPAAPPARCAPGRRCPVACGVTTGGEEGGGGDNIISYY